MLVSYAEAAKCQAGIRYLSHACEVRSRSGHTLAPHTVANPLTRMRDVQNLKKYRLNSIEFKLPRTRKISYARSSTGNVGLERRKSLVTLPRHPPSDPLLLPELRTIINPSTGQRYKPGLGQLAKWLETAAPEHHERGHGPTHRLPSGDKAELGEFSSGCDTQ